MANHIITIDCEVKKTIWYKVAIVAGILHIGLARSLPKKTPLIRYRIVSGKEKKWETITAEQIFTK